ncbi:MULTISPECIES: hypothetical protein [Acinetobacter]|uniref:hypothetical protein n=1 Tax=Acinetobacter TaxID=469 RepID=UPI0009926295|nr:MULTISPECIES: hypothetical protein [Acinetobacter]MCL6243236.1 hypothetical protein [Acinetobacter amyesii]OOV80745.1 hypothetical protein B1201_13525 [Acinetobacter sp. ANC 5600]
MINGQYIVLSFKEWNNWISQGLLKIHSFRIQPCQNSKHSFFNLMNTAADITHLDDNEYILAKLSKSYSSSTYQSEHTLASYINLEAVQQFYALTERGKFALKHSANNLQVSLATDLEIEKFWEAYRLDQKKILEHEKALKFTGLIFENKISKESLFDLINNKTLNEYFNPSKYEISHLQAQDEKAKKQLFSLESFDNTKAYAGMFTRLLFNLEVNDPVLIEKYKEISNLCSSREYYSSLKEQQTKDELTSKFLSKQILREKILTEYMLLESQIKHLPLLALSLYFHYEMLIKNNYPLNLSALKEDILSLNFFYIESECKEYNDLPYLVAFSIGKLLPSEFINTLYYYKTKAYPCFKTTHQSDLEQALPSIADEEFLETTLNELNEEISKTWTEVQRSIQISQISDVTPTVKKEDINASNITQLTVSTAITHPSEKDLHTQPQITQVPEINDLNPPMSVQQPEHPKPQSSSTNIQEQISLIAEHQVNEESLTVSSADETVAMPQHPLIERLIQLFNDPKIQDFKSLIHNLKADYTFTDITNQTKLRDRLISEGILNADNTPKARDTENLFNYMKIEIDKKI